MADVGAPQTKMLQKAAQGRHESLRLSQIVALSAHVSAQRDAKVLEAGNTNVSDTTTPKDTKGVSTEEPAKVTDQAFRLMDLPLEVRIMIFKELLVMPGPVMFRRYVKAERDEADLPAIPIPIINPQPFAGGQISYLKIDTSKVILQEPLLRVFLASKTIYRETVPIYFGINVFSFETLQFFEDFVSKLGPECRWQLARLKIRYFGKAPARAIKRLLDCVGLRELELELFSYSADSYEDIAPYAPLLYGVKDLLRVRGLRKLELDFSCYDHLPYFRYKEDFDPEKVKAAVIEQLQVLKQPQDPKKLKRLENKDFPARTMRRIVFGSANVVTRAEKRLLDAQ